MVSTAGSAPFSLDDLGLKRSTKRPHMTGLGGGYFLQDGPLKVAFLGRTSTEDQQDPTLSLPRQLASCHAALPEHSTFVAHFYDIESGRKDLAARGKGRGHERFSIPVPRDGGIQDLLEEAASPSRRFDVVICEEIGRVARRSYIGTMIEARLEEAGVLLLAADEPIVLNGKRSSQILTRRVKQGVAEWYVLQLLEMSWGGLQQHIEQGFNIGRPPYGYLGQKVPHPVPARRAQGATKHVCVPDPDRHKVVTAIFDWRVERLIGIQDIADELNRDLIAYPPPQPVDPSRALGKWTYSSVRAILTNPKYTGYQVWNRRATTSATGRCNPPEAWYWSSKPVHPRLVSLEMFLAAQEVTRRAERVRRKAGPNTACADTKRSYLLRSYITHASCDRRMWGKDNRGTTYYLCKPGKEYIDPGHPQSVWLREDYVFPGLTDFFNNQVFGRHRRLELAQTISDAEANALVERDAAIKAAEKAMAELRTRRTNLLGSLETTSPDAEFTNDVKARAAQLKAEIDAKTTSLAELKHSGPPAVQCAGLLDQLPLGRIDLEKLPEELLRKLFNAFRLEMRYDHVTNLVTVQITSTTEIIATQQEAAQAALETPKPAHDHDHARVCVVPPTGFEPVLPP
ncbi:recombinase family protein [Actinocorallia longicatena]|uniref:Recombinase family protein n=1 Tax=Actinocorallia longicatena TaxID=111803 RepID=A0ABP6QLA8_9ACTN